MTTVICDDNMCKHNYEGICQKQVISVFWTEATCCEDWEYKGEEWKNEENR